MNTPTALAATPSAAGAWQLLELHRPELALRMAEQLLAADPAALSALLARAEALRRLERLPEAAAAAHDALGAAPQSAYAHATLAQVVGQQGHLSQAEASITEALRLSLGVAKFYGFLAQLQYLQERPAQAIASAEAGLRTDAHHADCLLWLAMAQEAHGLPTAAENSFASALRMAPSSALAHEWRGNLLLRRYEPHQAAIHLTEALRLAPSSVPALLLLRQARRQQYWPTWLLRQHRKLRHDWRAARPFSWRILPVALFTTVFAARSWWHTRRDPVFAKKIPGQHRALLRKILVISILLAVLAGLIYAIAVFNLPPYLLIILVTALLRGVLARHQQPT